MNLNIKNAGFFKLATLAVIVFVAASCNKDLPDATPIVYPPVNNSATTIGAEISSNPNYSIFKAAATRVGALSGLNDSSKIFTVFLPDDNAFIASGIPSAAAIGALPIASVGGIVNYAIIPGEQYTSANVPSGFPNAQLPVSITIAKLPGTPIDLNLSTFPSVRSNGFWDNNIPVITPDLKMKNGVIHIVAGIVAPPSQLLKDMLYNNPDLTYFKAAVARADSGSTGLSRFDSLLNYAVTNMTVLAPNDDAFRTLIYGLVYGQVLALTGNAGIADAQATAAVGAGPAFLSTNNVTTELLRGVLAYHLLATPNPSTGDFEPNIRVFSVNFPQTSPTSPFFITTLVNTSVAVHPGIKVDATFTGPFVTDLKFTGLGTFPPGGAPYSGTPATATSLDNHAVNGVYYVIDHVLLPQ